MTISMLEPRALPVQLFVLWIITSRVWAIPWEGPRATGVTDYGVGTTPLPTGTSNDLVKRGQYPITVCGFIAGDLAVPATCSPGSSCVWFSDYNVVGCCTTSGNACTVPTTCIDRNSPKNTLPDNPLVYTCRSECYTNSYPLGYSQIGCGSSSWATFVGTDGPKDMSVFVTTSPGTGGDNPGGKPSAPPPKSSDSPSASTSASEPSSSSESTTSSTTSSSATTLQVSSSSSSSPSSSTTSSSSSRTGSSSSASPTAGAGGSGSNSNSGASASEPSPTSSSAPISTTDTGSNSNVGAIAGGAVGGGIAAIAASAAVIFLLLRRSKRRKRLSAGTSPSNYDKKHLSQHTATPYGSPATTDAPTMAPYSPDAYMYRRPASSAYDYSAAQNPNPQQRYYAQPPDRDSVVYPQRYQPYRPPPAELPNEPAMRYELPAR